MGSFYMEVTFSKAEWTLGLCSLLKAKFTPFPAKELVESSSLFKDVNVDV